MLPPRQRREWLVPPGLSRAWLSFVPHIGSKLNHAPFSPPGPYLFVAECGFGT
jgi:hypothetical protein